MHQIELIYFIKGGGFLASRRLALRLVAGALCILAFVLVTAYQSVLISFILAPGMQPPIISSVTDLAKKPDVHLVVDKGMAIDVFLTVSLCCHIEKSII